MKAFALIRMSGGLPDFDREQYPYHGHVLCDQFGNWGAYLISGTGAQLQAIDGLSGVVGICAVTEDDDVRWAELDGAIGAAVRTKINNWLEARELPAIPAGWSLRQVVLAIYRRFNDRFDLGWFDVADSG
jgi:hypothetical protein